MLFSSTPPNSKFGTFHYTMLSDVPEFHSLTLVMATCTNNQGMNYSRHCKLLSAFDTNFKKTTNSH